MRLRLSLRDALSRNILTSASPLGDGFSLGASSLADIRVSATGVSAVHCRFEPREAGTWWVCNDLGSTSGTLCVRPDGSRLLLKSELCELSTGTAIFVGACHLIVELESTSESSEAAVEEDLGATQPFSYEDIAIPKADDLEDRLADDGATMAAWIDEPGMGVTTADISGARAASVPEAAEAPPLADGVKEESASPLSPPTATRAEAAAAIGIAAQPLPIVANTLIYEQAEGPYDQAPPAMPASTMPPSSDQLRPFFSEDASGSGEKAESSNIGDPHPSSDRAANDDSNEDRGGAEGSPECLPLPASKAEAIAPYACESEEQRVAATEGDAHIAGEHPREAMAAIVPEPVFQEDAATTPNVVSAAEIVVAVSSTVASMTAHVISNIGADLRDAGVAEEHHRAGNTAQPILRAVEEVGEDKGGGDDKIDEKENYEEEEDGMFHEVGETAVPADSVAYVCGPVHATAPPQQTHRAAVAPVECTESSQQEVISSLQHSLEPAYSAADAHVSGGTGSSLGVKEVAEGPCGVDEPLNKSSAADSVGKPVVTDDTGAHENVEHVTDSQAANAASAALAAAVADVTGQTIVQPPLSRSPRARAGKSDVPLDPKQHLKAILARGGDDSISSTPIEPPIGPGSHVAPDALPIASTPSALLAIEAPPTVDQPPVSIMTPASIDGEDLVDAKSVVADVAPAAPCHPPTSAAEPPLLQQEASVSTRKRRHLPTDIAAGGVVGAAAVKESSKQPRATRSAVSPVAAAVEVVGPRKRRLSAPIDALEATAAAVAKLPQRARATASGDGTKDGPTMSVSVGASSSSAAPPKSRKRQNPEVPVALEEAAPSVTARSKRARPERAASVEPAPVDSRGQARQSRTRQVTEIVEASSALSKMPLAKSPSIPRVKAAQVDKAVSSSLRKFDDVLSGGDQADSGSAVTLHFTLFDGSDAERLIRTASASTLFSVSPTLIPGCILVTPNVVRSIKVCEAFCTSRAVMTPTWVQESLRAGRILPLGDGYESPHGEALRQLRLCSTAEAFARRSRLAPSRPLDKWTIAVAKPSKADASTRHADFIRLASLLGAKASESGRPEFFAAICTDDSDPKHVERLKRAGATLANIYFLTDACLTQTTPDIKEYIYGPTGTSTVK